MKRLMPSGLIDFLAANPNCNRADLFSLALPNGQTLTATSGQFDITLPSGTNGWSGSTTTFHATKYGRWERGSITSEASFSLNSNTMTLTCFPQQTTTYPGTSIGLLAAALNNLFDAASVSVFTAYMPLGSYGDVSNGVETKFVGTITKINDIQRTKVEFDCADPFYLLNLKVPTRVFQSNCPWSFGDSNCDPSGGIAAFTQSFTAKSGSTQWTLTPVSAFSQGTGYFSQGVVKCLTGANAGLSQTVKLHDSSGNLQLMVPFLLAPSAGDTFSVVAGCDKSLSTCQTKFNNASHFGGQPFVPAPSNAL
jgi:uncharacterized phage protein (TIGR02218 family)